MLPSFIEANTGKADVLVSGSTYIQSETEGSEALCTDIPLGDAHLRTDVTIDYQVSVILLQL